MNILMKFNLVLDSIFLHEESQINAENIGISFVPVPKFIRLGVVTCK